MLNTSAGKKRSIDDTVLLHMLWSYMYLTHAISVNNHVANHVVCLVWFTTLRTSNRTSQVRKTVHNVILSRISCGKVQTNSYFSAQNFVKVSPGFAAVSRLLLYPITEYFPIFLQLVEVI